MKHIHKFKKAKYKTGTEYFFCTGGDCFFKLDKSLASGKLTLCWRCNRPFELNKYAIGLVKPHCEECHQLSSSRNKKDKGVNIEELIPNLENLIDSGIDKVNESKFSFAGQQRTRSVVLQGSESVVHSAKPNEITKSLKERLNSSASASAFANSISSSEREENTQDEMGQFEPVDDL